MVFKPIIPSPPPAAREPITKRAEAPERWAFGFRFFRQIEFFGLSGAQPKWFVSVLEKLTVLSNECVEQFLSDTAKRDAWRYHGINWSQPNIPIQRADLDWIHPDYRNNPEEFPLVQFQISKALGRVIGFFDESSVFQIVLLDPLHNMQPSSSHNYRVDPCSPLTCEYTDLRERVLAVREEQLCNEGDCPVIEKLDVIEMAPPDAFNVVMIKPKDDLVEAADELIRDGHALSLVDIFETGILTLLENNAAPPVDDADNSEPPGPEAS